MVSACRSVRDCPWQMPPQRKPGEGAESEGMGLGRGESLVIYGPLVEIGPRVAGVMASGLLALAALRISGRAFCERGFVVFLAAWVLGIVGFFLAAWIGVASLGFYGSAATLRGAPDPLSEAEICKKG